MRLCLYGCETWSLTLREERNPSVFENMVLRSVFGPRRDEVTGAWRRLHNEELNYLYSWPKILRVIKSKKWDGLACGKYGWGEGAYRFLVGKPMGKRPLGRPRCRWVDNFRMDFEEVSCGYVDWIGWPRSGTDGRSLWEREWIFEFHKNAENFLTCCKPFTFSRKTLHHWVNVIIIFIIIIIISVNCTYECARKILLDQWKSELRHMSQSESRKIHYINIRATVILGYSDFQDHLSYFNMIQSVEACGVGRSKAKYNDPVIICCQFWHGNVVTASK